MVYYVEDDLDILELVKYSLNSSNIDLQGVVNGEQLFNLLAISIPDLILLDLMLPNDNGYDILQKLKSSNLYQNIPVIIISAKTMEFDKVKALDYGADDYISKPFGVMELIARVKAVLRRVQIKNTETVLKFKEISLDLQKHIATYNQDSLNLTLKEFELLKKLVSNQNIVLSRDVLLQAVWGYDYSGETRTVDVHIKTLRSKMGIGKQYIQTIHGVGYKLSDYEK